MAAVLPKAGKEEAAVSVNSFTAECGLTRVTCGVTNTSETRVESKAEDVLYCSLVSAEHCRLRVARHRVMRWRDSLGSPKCLWIYSAWEGMLSREILDTTQLCPVAGCIGALAYREVPRPIRLRAESFPPMTCWPWRRANHGTADEGYHNLGP